MNRSPGQEGGSGDGEPVSNSPYLEEILKGLEESRGSPLGDGSFTPWSSFTEDSPFQYTYDNSWSTYRTDIDYTIGCERPSPLSQFATYEDYIASLNQAESNSDNGSESGCFGQYTGRVDGLATNVDIPEAAEQGRDMYTEAMNQWGSGNFSGVYSPFGSSPVLQDTKNVMPKPHQTSVDTGKPTYSDVTKNNPPSGSGPKSKQDEYKVPGGGRPDAHLSSNQKAPFKRAKLPRAFFSRSKNSSTDAGPSVQPNSKYGLDSFEDPVQSAANKDPNPKVLCADGLPPSRKGSTSSVSSTTSGIEEIQLSKSVNAYNTAGPGPGVGVKYDARKAEFLEDRGASPCSSEANHVGAADLSKPAPKTTKSSRAQEKPFFDPKRIFTSEKKSSDKKKPGLSGKQHTVPNNHQNSRKEKEETLLNNGKPRSNYANNCSMNKNASATYINNDLRDKSDMRKQTNTPGWGGCQERSYSGGDRRDSGARATAANSTSAQRKSESVAGKKAETQHQQQKVSSKKAKKYQPNVAAEWCKRGWEWSKWACLEVIHILWNLGLLVLKFLLLLLLLALHYFVTLCKKIWGYIHSKLPSWLKFGRQKDEYDWSNPSAQNRFRTHGLEENIQLPGTGEEAMKRLLACKGKDPYSILGVRCDASDDDIKKYYRRQAVLVHPDKNQQPGAEEAFKILGHAFELIGETERRRAYDSQRMEAQDTAAAMQEFADLLTKLQEKMQEAANMMRCDNCGGKHRRVPVDRPWYSARYCDRCNTRHSAKEGDLWAESSVLGFLWHYYACMEGHVFDITEWASCQQGHFKHMQANAHHVIYRIASHAKQQQQQSRTNEAELEDFINHLFHHTTQTDGNKTGNYNYGSSGQQSRSAWNASNNTANAGKKKRRKRKH